MISVVRGNVVAVEQAAVAVQVREDRLGDLQRALLGLDQGRLQRVDVVATPQALVPDDRDLAVDAVDRVEVVLDAHLFEDVGVAGVEAAFLLDLAELTTARTVEGVTVIQQEDALGVILAVGVLAVADAAFHAGHPFFGRLPGPRASTGASWRLPEISPGPCGRPIAIPVPALRRAGNPQEMSRRLRPLLPLSCVRARGPVLRSRRYRGAQLGNPLPPSAAGRITAQLLSQWGPCAIPRAHASPLGEWVSGRLHVDEISEHAGKRR